MLLLLFVGVVLIHVLTIAQCRCYRNDSEKTAFYCGITGLVCLPLLGVGLLKGASNIQGIHGDLTGYVWLWLVFIGATLRALYQLGAALLHRDV